MGGRRRTALSARRPLFHRNRIAAVLQHRGDFWMVAVYLFLALAVMSYIFTPLFQPQKRLDEPSRRADRRRQLLEERERIYASIRDLDFDYRTGKLEEPDYRSGRAELTAQAVVVLKELDAVEGKPSGETPAPKPAGDLDAKLEAEIAAARRGSRNE